VIILQGVVQVAVIGDRIITLVLVIG
jgi:hypothetical protein